jgi:hypothetical protein
MNDQMMTIAHPDPDDKRAMVMFANTHLSNAIRNLISAKVAFEKGNATVPGASLSSSLQHTIDVLCRLRAMTPDPAFAEMMAKQKEAGNV